jgi:hypothetical protein
MLHEMFVSLVIHGGIARRGFTRASNTSTISPRRTTTAATSVMRSPWYGRPPVVSTSTTT